MWWEQEWPEGVKRAPRSDVEAARAHGKSRATVTRQRLRMGIEAHGGEGQGHRPVPDGERRTATIWITSDHADALRAGAEREGRTVGGWLEWLGVRRARKVLGIDLAQPERARPRMSAKRDRRIGIATTEAIAEAFARAAASDGAESVARWLEGLGVRRARRVRSD